MDNTRPTWAEIDLAAIEHNIIQIKKYTDANIMAVVKANAYGHGIEETLRVLSETGVTYLGVATLNEALTIREAGFSLPILVIGHVPEEFAEILIENDIAVTIYNTTLAPRLSQVALKLRKKATIHIKIDTGMGRLGFAPKSNSIDEIEQIAKLPGLELEGIFTHFADADNVDKEFAHQQLACFNYVVSELGKRGIKFKIKHTANSAALLTIPEAHFDMVRAGIIIYGLCPAKELNNLNFIPAMRLKSKISFVQTVPVQTTIGYGRTYLCENVTKVATVPIGYADGYSRLLSNKAWAIIKNQRVNLIGNVCMDQCMFNVSDVENVKIGDEIILFGRREDGITADNLADIMGTINYEVLCSISARVPRIYI
ncbi:MAG TPA: alanine racemase [Syntrophomonadaceae bacterium]|nr:alanine racemase [Syntrophomonadaceae bacterium]